MEPSAISTKGQIVIPYELRQRYHLRPRSRALWIDMGGALLLVARSKNPLKESRGILKNSRFTQTELKKDRARDKKRG